MLSDSLLSFSLFSLILQFGLKKRSAIIVLFFFLYYTGIGNIFER